MRVLVTGASGFVGAYAVASLLAAGHRPRLLVRDPGKTVQVLGAVGVHAEAVELHPGPYQPHLNTMMEGLAAALRLAWPMPRGGVTLVDVRDLGDALTRSVVSGRGIRRFLLGGHYLRWTEFADLCDEMTGVRCRRIAVPGWLLLAAGSALDAAKRIRHFDYPLTRDAAEIIVTMTPSDDSGTLDTLGIRLRPIEESVEDALRWLAHAGYLSDKKAGRLAPAHSTDFRSTR